MKYLRITYILLLASFVGMVAIAFNKTQNNNYHTEMKLVEETLTSEGIPLYRYEVTAKKIK